jgi:hypothetical protein
MALSLRINLLLDHEDFDEGIAQLHLQGQSCHIAMEL